MWGEKKGTCKGDRGTCPGNGAGKKCFAVLGKGRPEGERACGGARRGGEKKNPTGNVEGSGVLVRKKLFLRSRGVPEKRRVFGGVERGGGRKYQRGEGGHSPGRGEGSDPAQ